MPIEVPVLRLGLAGFSAQQQELAAAIAQAASGPGAAWELAPFPDADAWWFEGSRSQVTPEGLLRIKPGIPSARSIQLNLPDVDRPTAFTLPLNALAVHADYTFDLADPGNATEVLERFRAWLQPGIAQFCLAAFIVDHQVGLGTGAFQVTRGDQLLAVVDLRVGVGVLPTATPTDFSSASFSRRASGAAEMPEHFARTTLSQLMWQFALRTNRDLLPAHYRKQPVYFRRPPRLSQRQLRDAHLLLLRELAGAPATFDELQQRTGLATVALARDLAALYFVGAITSNPKRASRGLTYRSDAHEPKPGTPSSLLPSVLDSTAPEADGQRRPPPDLTAPAPLIPS